MLITPTHLHGHCLLPTCYSDGEVPDWILGSTESTNINSWVVVRHVCDLHGGSTHLDARRGQEPRPFLEPVDCHARPCVHVAAQLQNVPRLQQEVLCGVLTQVLDTFCSNQKRCHLSAPRACFYFQTCISLVVWHGAASQLNLIVVPSAMTFWSSTPLSSIPTYTHAQWGYHGDRGLNDPALLHSDPPPPHLFVPPWIIVRLRVIQLTPQTPSPPFSLQKSGK